MRFTTSVIFLALITVSLAGVSSAFAGGIGLGATRVIYPESANQASLSVTNSDPHERYLIQTWVEDQQGNKVRDFIVTPPLFASAPKSENTLRILYTSSPLPQDREKVYWMSVKAIPAIDKEAIKGKNTLQLAILSRIKLFMRPDKLAMSKTEASRHLRFQQSAGRLTITNPTPYYETLVNLTVAGKKLPNTMVSPRSQKTLTLPAGTTGSVRFQSVNDYGALTSPQIGQP
ncbi:fimbrial chaperone protein FimC [Erwinia sp. OLTSP20]|uniref:fimbria/pilus periplasmic chaperone n=1 Tax=unclassified Erwinia TaxID=2622719 RepID=UPI000C17CBF0|nr:MULTISPECIES: fimbria/pilus periplasmic chaperone [unclassified Erwinia]PIJ49713.1 fimbrial chaperone protein FimC [Erwinia sp. OAMSP11]PIJ70811.1 fimbrial chaperone protein FimC [Erwinia sp. OLSSP12]PIJ80177.1 fimbrial chaperone protein FimC [Erwinia sp. OLCASP19]PIJ82300.1 fimbrial chaperone protein FimC [Erwinia sp. OLMTSP26]PIJ84987.1 fimbrial chaperone protein FimC [Erwinia sp. OLMDSP33]